MSMRYPPVPVVSRSPFFRVNGTSTMQEPSDKKNNSNKDSKHNKNSKTNTKQTGRFSDSTSSDGSMLNCCDGDADAFFADDVQSAEEEILASLARSAMHRVLAAATSSAFADDEWRERKRSVHEVVYEQRTAREFSIIARAMVPCTINEISSVLSSDDSDQLNATLIELLGDQFGYAINVRAIPTARSASLHSDLSVKFLSFGRRGRSLLSRASIASALDSPSFISNGSGQRNVTILDYVETDPELRTTCRVMQTIRRTEDLTIADDPQSILGDAFCGYVLREDPATKHTLVAFYGSHALLKTDANNSKNKTRKNNKLSFSTINALRKMTRVTNKWVEIARRRRLGAQTIILYDSSAQLLSASSSSVRLLSSCCFTCDQQFRPLVRKKHLCCLCGYFICGRCSSPEDIEQRIGLVQRLRVCDACLSSVNRKAFNTSSSSSKRGNSQHRW